MGKGGEPGSRYTGLPASFDDCRTADERAFDTAYERYYRRACRFASGRFGADNAPDLVQEAFTRLWRRWSMLDHERELWPLLRTVIERIAFDVHRQESRLTPLTVEVLPPLAGGEDVTIRDVLDSETASFVGRCLRQLPVDDRDLLVAHHLLGAGLRHLAEQHGTSEAAIRGRLYRARKEFRRLYRGVGGPLLACVAFLRRPARRPSARALAKRIPRTGSTIGVMTGLGIGFATAAIAIPGPTPFPDPAPTPIPRPTVSSVSVSPSPQPLPTTAAPMTSAPRTSWTNSPDAVALAAPGVRASRFTPPEVVAARLVSCRTVTGRYGGSAQEITYSVTFKGGEGWSFKHYRGQFDEISTISSSGFTATFVNVKNTDQLTYVIWDRKDQSYRGYSSDTYFVETSVRDGVCTGRIYRRRR